ncbi:MAG TPA: OPT/YSL family transporter [Candidatus Dependentiae bacterium]|nr:OPT/YSL family transporter [Candidatus Dependentiae bacterium]HRQ63236.1 OPT/YSL family transporter [Candidatus Dependentiae bacterium]
MNISTLIVSCILSIFSTAVMSYIAMATAIGPWITPTVVLCAILLLSLVPGSLCIQNIGFVTVASSIGGILATALGFSLPTLYFLDPLLFDTWLAAPYYFVTVTVVLSLSSGWLGMWIANVAEQKLIDEEKLSFPVGELAYSMITAASNQIRKAYELGVGFVSTFVFCILQHGIGLFQSLIPKTCTIFGPVSLGYVCIPIVRLDLFPLFWAVGFVTGHMVVIPLVVGVLAKIFLLEPLNKIWFAHLTSVEFVLAFCSGMVLSGAFTGFSKLPKQLWQGLITLRTSMGTRYMQGTNGMYNKLLEFFLVIIFCVGVLTYFNFSYISQAYLLVFTGICAYQIAAIAGKIGLALLGRYATFVLVPGMLVFGYDAIQIMIVSTFVQIAGGVATDVLFGRKIGQLAHMDHVTLKKYQYLGLLVSSVAAGIAMWLLINHFHLGSDQLFAPKAQARQLLVQAKQFDYWVLLLGALFGYLLDTIKVSSTLVFGGLLMPVNLVLGLVVGGLSTWLTKDKEAWYPFWSGVFAANSIWMILQALI